MYITFKSYCIISNFAGQLLNYNVLFKDFFVCMTVGADFFFLCSLRLQDTCLELCEITVMPAVKVTSVSELMTSTKSQKSSSGKVPWKDDVHQGVYRQCRKTRKSF